MGNFSHQNPYQGGGRKIDLYIRVPGGHEHPENITSTTVAIMTPVLINYFPSGIS